jgi:hypothetical protein
MRLWTIHPRYLDAPGLVAVWREALLAQAVLRGKTTGYTRHPQLARFQDSPSPLGSVAWYLDAVYEEATRRGYRFDRSKIGRRGGGGRLKATLGQLRYEWRHFKAKLSARDRAWLARVWSVRRPKAHPLFRIVKGPAEAWEVGRVRRRTRG